MTLFHSRIKFRGDDFIVKYVLTDFYNFHFKNASFKNYSSFIHENDDFSNKLNFNIQIH